MKEPGADSDGDIKMAEDSTAADANTSLQNTTQEQDREQHQKHPKAPSPLATNSVDQEPFVVVGEEPTPLSPVDREPPKFDFESLEASSPRNRNINLPLPASSSFQQTVNTDKDTTDSTNIDTTASSIDTATASTSTPQAVTNQTDSETPISPPSRATTDLSNLSIASPVIISPEPRSATSNNTSLPPISTDQTMRSKTPMAELPADPITNSNADSDKYSITEDPAFAGGMPRVSDVTDSLLSSPDDFKDYEAFTGQMPMHAKQLRERERLRENKSLDPAVMYDIPATPSAQAYQIASTNVTDGYFEPEFPNDVKTI